MASLPAPEPARRAGGPRSPGLARVLALAALAGLAASAARAESPDDSLRTRLLREVSAEAASVRERAAQRLEAMEELTPADVAAAIGSASPRARPLLFRVAAVHGMTELVPALAQAAASADSPSAEAAIRALVSLGTDAVTAGREAVAGAEDEVLPVRERAARLRHLQALAVQRRVEHDVLSRWRRKGGSYRGRYASLAGAGWDAQPVLLAMLLDVPLEDQFVVVPETGDPDADRMARIDALRSLAASRRRGYRTFDPLPANVELDHVFDLAQQALVDVADLDLMGTVLADTQVRLKQAHESGQGVFRPRLFEDGYAQAIEVILAARGAPELLEERRRELETSVQAQRRWLSRLDPEDATDEYRFYCIEVADLAAVLHQLEEFEKAAQRYVLVVGILKRITGKDPAIHCYNAACALARAGRADDALAMLERSLDPAAASGSEDLTREWVTEDGDLQSLHADPRFEEIVRRRFGP